MRKLDQHDNGYELWDYGDRFVIKHRNSEHINGSYTDHEIAVEEFRAFEKFADNQYEVRAGL